MSEKKEKGALTPQATEVLDINESFLASMNRKYLIAFKALFFTLHLAYYSCYIFKTKFFKDVLLIPESDSAFIYAAGFIVTSLGSVFWPFVSDRTMRPKAVLIVTMISSCALFQLFLLMPMVPDEYDMAVKVSLILCWTFCYSAVQPLLDAIIVNQLYNEGHGIESYGKQRCWGTVGYAVVTMVVGKLIVAKKDGSQSELRESYNPMFFVFAIATAVFLVLFYFLSPPDDPEAEKSRRDLAKSSAETANNIKVELKSQQWKSLLTNPLFLFLLLVTLFVGYGRQSMFMLRSLYVEEVTLRGEPDRKFWVSMTTVSGLVFDFLILFCGKELLLRVEKSWLMTLSLLAVSVRVWAHYFVPENNRNWIYFLIAVELTRGIHIGLLQVAGVQMSAEVAGPDLKSTAQGIFFAVNMGISGVFGSLGSGFILRATQDINQCFFWAGILTTTSFVFSFAWPLFSRWYHRQK